ncbi:Metallo-dependent hydrolase, partial [Pisolithus marmoratus]
MTMVSYALSHKAYVKIFLHAAKHPHRPVNGVLVGNLSSGVVDIQDVIPLLHHWTSLSPMMEIGLDLAKGHAESLGLALVGYYQACERADDRALAPVGERVAQQIRNQFNDAVAFVIDGDALGSGEAALIPYLPQPGSGTTSWRPRSFDPPAFTSGSQVTLVNPASPLHAVALVRDSHLHDKFGDFDDHLEDVTIDWLGNRACQSTMTRNAGAGFAIRGTLVHCPSLGVVEVLRDHLLVVDHAGIIGRLSPATDDGSVEYIKQNDVRTLPPGSFLIPTFCDLHLHAPQFMYQGTGLDLPLMQWLDKYAYKAEELLDARPDMARKVYKRLAQRLIEVGTGAVLLFGTINTETNLILANAMQTLGVRAFVGKLSMDISSRETYREASSADSLANAESFIQMCRNSVANLEPCDRLIEPVITPRFVPTCSNGLLEGLGKLSEEKAIRIQSHLAESYDEAKWVKDERHIDDIEVFDKYGLLREGTVQAHCTFLDNPSLSCLAQRHTAVAHCPLSNVYFSEKPFPLREALDAGVMVGLGTDVAGGYSIDIMSSMRHAVAVSRMRESTRVLERIGECGGNTETSDCETRSLAITWKESLYLATRGGALALGLSKVGELEVGSPLDAQEIAVYDVENGVGIGALDFFDEPSGITLEMIEKWWCMGDTRNRVGMWVQGKKLV